MFTEKEKFLANEAALTASLLGNGMNALRKADIYNKGLYYQAFFSLSIGIERLLKIIIINQYRCKYEGEFPVDIDLKKVGHDLNKLCEYAGIIFKKESLHYKIILFLNNFAIKSRYYNIDSMLDKKINYYDPLCEWSLIMKELLESVGRKSKVDNKDELAKLIDSVSLISFYDLEGNEITSGLDVLNQSDDREIMQAYSIQYMFEIITKLVSEIRRLEDEKYMMPVLSEFFPLYRSHWKPYEIRAKKDWLRIY